MTERDRRSVVEVQIRAIVSEPGRLYDFVHALIEECYRHTDPATEQHWRDVARALTAAERIVEQGPTPRPPLQLPTRAIVLRVG